MPDTRSWRLATISISFSIVAAATLLANRIFNMVTYETATWEEYLHHKEGDVEAATKTSVLAYLAKIGATPKQAAGIKSPPRNVTAPTESTHEAMAFRVVDELATDYYIAMELQKSKRLHDAQAAAAPLQTTQTSGGSNAVGSQMFTSPLTGPASLEEQAAITLMGNHESALSFIRSVSNAKKVNVAGILEQADLRDLSHHFYPPKEVFQLIYSDHEAAVHETPPRFSFLYINLLDKSMFPLWFDRSLVGSKPPVMTQVDMAQNNMLEFGKEIVKAASGRPFFRSISHWVVMMWRWAIPAIGCNAWSLKAQLAYVDKIVHLSVKESMKSNMGMYISMLYDELERQEWMERTRKGDKSLDSLQKLEVEAGKIDERLLEAAKTKLPGVLEACADMSSASSAPAHMGLHPTSYFLVPTSYVLRLIYYFLFLTSYFVLLTSYFLLLLTSYFLLLTSYFLLLTSYFLLLTSYF